MRKSLYRRHNQVFLGLLRRYREQGKFRQRDLAQHLGSVQATVSKAETGTRRLDVIELREWLLAMGVDFLEFMTELHEQLQALNDLEPWLFARAAMPLPDAEMVEHASDARGTSLNSLSKAIGQGALLAELERVRLELQPDPLRAEARRRYLKGHASALAELLVPQTRDGLLREVADTLAEQDNLQIRGRPLSRWFKSLSWRLGSDIGSLLQPGDAEIRNNAQELAQLLMSNWLGLLAHSTRGRVGELIEALRGDTTILPAEVSTGCLAYPVPEEEARNALAAYLRAHWVPDILNQWQTHWGQEQWGA